MSDTSLHKPTAVGTGRRGVPIVQPFSALAPRQLEWLWPTRIPQGAVTLLAGDPGLGKSLLTIDLAARVSAGRDWPDGATGQPGGVLMMNDEDSDEQTVRPRLSAAGADLTRVVSLSGVQDGVDAEATRGVSLLTDMLAIELAVEQCPDCRLLVIDPISAYLGDQDANNNAKVRKAMMSLADLARRQRIAVLVVTHLNKRDAGRLLYRAMGAIALVAAVRMIWAVARDPNAERVLLLPLKSNMGGRPLGMAYEVTERGGCGVIDWQPEAIAESAEELLAPQERFNLSKQTYLEKEAGAVAWLRERLAGGPEENSTLEWEAKNAQITGWELFKASRELGVLKTKSAIYGRWEWQLPAQSEAEQQREVRKKVRQNRQRMRLLRKERETE